MSVVDMGLDLDVAGRPWRNAWHWPLPEWLIGTLDEDRQLKTQARHRTKKAIVPTLWFAIALWKAQSGAASARA